MGEFADMMIYGDMCPCGEYLGAGPGFPQYCSKQCERDYGPQTGDADFEGGTERCTECGQSFGSDHALKQHIRAKHPKTFRAKHAEQCCPHCGKICASAHGVAEHFLVKHAGTAS